MATLKVPNAPAQSFPLEPDGDRVTRIAHELELVEQAETALEAGLGIDGDDLEKWLSDLDQDENTPLPQSTGRKVHFR